jgi:hypothetical protein
MVATPLGSSRSRAARRRENFRSTPRKEFFNRIGHEATVVARSKLVGLATTQLRTYGSQPWNTFNVQEDFLGLHKPA